MVRLVGDVAIIHANTSSVKPDRSTEEGWYSDGWPLRDGT
jgi:hypothetical protein